MHTFTRISGAGLTNIIFSNYNTAVLELFPYNYYVPGFYGALALQSGLVYAAWYDSDPTHADATCMKKEWINGGPDICHETGSCRACARNVNLTINTEKQLHEIRFTFAHLMRLREESNLKNTIEIPTDNPYYQKQSFYGWTPFHSKYAFNEERTDKYSPYADIFRNIASNGIVGDIIHFGGGYINGFLTMAKLYIQRYNLHHNKIRICVMEKADLDPYCLRFNLHANVWEKDRLKSLHETCIALLHINTFYSEELHYALNTFYKQVSIKGGYIYIGARDGEMKKEYAIQFHLHDFIQEKQLEHVTSIRKYVGYHDKLLEDGTSYHGDVSFRRWSLYHDSNYTSNNPWEHNNVCTTPFL